MYVLSSFRKLINQIKKKNWPPFCRGRPPAMARCRMLTGLFYSNSNDNIQIKLYLRYNTSDYGSCIYYYHIFDTLWYHTWNLQHSVTLSFIHHQFLHPGSNYIIQSLENNCLQAWSHSAERSIKSGQCFLRSCSILVEISTEEYIWWRNRYTF